MSADTEINLDEIYFDHEYNFTEDQMKELHENGVLYATQTDEDGIKMTIKFTYNPGEIRDEDEEERLCEQIKNIIREK